ncbi:hypothetical protein [Halalkalibacillus sediminis]|uniref:hypothetical protein n=1 Tax=Halalkalibacillus sediminis TaxID=2018042 RepID=UPI00138FACDD|nr:hypothetical protein [Halalkalibacillus sediminis]
MQTMMEREAYVNERVQKYVQEASVFNKRNSKVKTFWTKLFSSWRQPVSPQIKQQLSAK